MVVLHEIEHNRNSQECWRLETLLLAGACRGSTSRWRCLLLVCILSTVVTSTVNISEQMVSPSLPLSMVVLEKFQSNTK